MEAQLTAANRGLRDWLGHAWTLGPALVAVLAALGPRDIVTNAIAGSAAGTSLVWVIAVAVVVRGTMLDAAGRYTLVTGESILAGTGGLSKWAAWAWLGATVVRRHAGALVNIVLLGTAANLVIPLPIPHAIYVWGLASWGASFALQYWGRYRLIQKMCRPLTACLALCVIVATVLSRPDWGEVLSGIVQPQLPPQDGVYSPALIVLAVLASTMGSSTSLKYSSYIHEAGWRDTSRLRKQRIDLLISLGGMFVVLVLMQVVAATTLRPLGVEIRELEDMLPIFGQTMGRPGALLFGLLLWGVTFAVNASNGSGYGIMFADVYHRFVRPSKQVTEEGKPPGEMPAYRWLVAYSFLTPLYVVFTGWTAVPLVLAGSLLGIVVVPVVAVVLLRLTSDRRIMGRHANGWFTNSVLVLAVLCSIYLTWEAGADLIQDLHSVQQ